MKNTKRLLALLLAVLMLALYGCGDTDGEDTDETETVDNIVWYKLVADGLSDYVIITPKGETDVFSKAYALSSAIESVTGVQLKVVQDTYGEQDKEILVGVTSREVGDGVLDALNTPDDYAVLKAEQKILLYGATESAIDSAIAYFTENYVSTATDKVLKVPENLSYVYHSDKEYITLDGSYVIVANTEDMESAKTVQTALKEKAGLELRILGAADDVQNKEIVVGDAGRRASTELEQAITSSFVGTLAVASSRFCIVGGSDVALGAAAERFAEELESLMFRGKFMVASDYNESLSLGEEVAEEILTGIGMNGIQWNYTVKTDEVRVYTPDGSNSAWYYSHHPFMTKFGDKYYIFYSSGRRNEDDCGQRIMMATSTDFQNWKVDVLVDSVQGAKSEHVLYVAGLYVYNDVLTVYYKGYEYSNVRNQTDATCDYPYVRPLATEDCSKSTGTYCHYIQTTDGVNWTEAKSLGAVSGGNMSPKVYKGADGKEVLLWAGYGSLSYTEDLSGVSGWKNITLKLASGVTVPAITESTIYQLSDGTLLHMSRTNGSYQLASASFDGGKTWTEMYLTGFPEYSAKFEYGTLPDGRYYYIGNIHSSRDQLVLMISENGIDFEVGYYLGIDDSYKQQKTGLYKGGAYGYPTTYIDGEYLYVCYSIEKEAVGAVRVKLSDIGVK